LSSGEFIVSDLKGTFSDIQSVMGVLLGLFATVFSFVGITTGEVTAILRNEPGKTPLVALFLLVGLLAAVLTVVITNPDVASPLDLAVLIVLLLGVATIVISAIPVQSSKRLSPCWGIAICVIAILSLSCYLPPFKNTKLMKDKILKRIIPVKVVLIVASVILISTSVDTALRLETQSQLHTTVQVAAGVAESGSDTMLTIHLTAAKVTNDSSVKFEVSGVNSGDPKKTVLRNIASGDMDPDVNGDIDNTLEIRLLPGSFDSINIITGTCSASGQAPMPKPTAPSQRPHIPPSPTSPLAAGTASSAKATPTKTSVSRPSSSSSTTPTHTPGTKAPSTNAPSPKAAPAPVDFSDCSMNSEVTIANPVPSAIPLNAR
jgi:hypothetical protein